MMGEQERSFKPSELEVGMIFNEVELIVERGVGNMATIRYEEGEVNGRSHDMVTLAYVLIPSKNGVKTLLNGSMEIFPDDEVYHDFIDKLNQRKLLPNN